MFIMKKSFFLLATSCLLILTACHKEPINPVVDPHYGLFGEHTGSYNKRITYANEHGMQSDSTYPDTCMNLQVVAHNTDSVFISLDSYNQYLYIDSISDNYVCYLGTTSNYWGGSSGDKTDYTLRHYQGDSIVLHIHYSSGSYHGNGADFWNRYIDFKYIFSD